MRVSGLREAMQGELLSLGWRRLAVPVRAASVLAYAPGRDDADPAAGRALAAPAVQGAHRSVPGWGKGTTQSAAAAGAGCQRRRERGARPLLCLQGRRLRGICAVHRAAEVQLPWTALKQGLARVRMEVQ